MTRENRTVCVGQIAGVHGVKGLVRLQSFTDPPRNLARYPVLCDEAGVPVRLKIRSETKGQFLAEIEGVSDRTRAEALKGRKLYVDRKAMPDAAEGEFYHADLIGLAALSHDGTPLGQVKAVHNYGAGDVLEIVGGGRGLLIPFTKAFVPEVDVAAGRITVAPFAEVE